MLNIVHGHLSKGVHHDPGCDEKCVAGCGMAAFEAWLDGPVLESDRLADERREQRLQALMRGEVPA